MKKRRKGVGTDVRRLWGVRAALERLRASLCQQVPAGYSRAVGLNHPSAVAMLW